MPDWSEGYVTDIPYALGYYRETVPGHIAFAAACVGANPGRALRPKRVLDLGFGMGLSFVVNAAANPDIHFEGVDFNPLHVVHAGGLAEAAALTNVSIREASFQDLARTAREGEHDLDIIVLHGIMSWVSPEAHEAIVEIARKRLGPGGLLYVSYNCMPGWAPVAPLRRLMRENAKRVAGGSDRQVGSGHDLLKALISEGAAYFRVNQGLEQHVAQMNTSASGYLAHEYLNANWSIFYFADIAEMFGQAKLSFVGSATLIENSDQWAIPEGVRARIGGETDPIFKETLRDIASNKKFRRDLFARGLASLTPAEHMDLLGRMRFILAVPRGQVVFKIPSPIGELDANVEIYGAVADLLAEKAASFAEIAALPVFAKAGAGDLVLQTMSMFVHSGQVLPVPSGDGSNVPIDPTPAQRLNRVLSQKMLQGRGFGVLAAPAAGSGISVNLSDSLALAALLAGQRETAEDVSGHVAQTVGRLGFVPESNMVEWRAALATNAEAFLSERLPLWRRLGVVPQT